MADTTKTERLMAMATSADRQARTKYSQEWQQTGRAFELELRSKDGRSDEGVAWALYRRRKWSISPDGTECLRLLFADAAVTIYGHNLRRLTERLKEERLELVEEHDAAKTHQREEDNRQKQPEEWDYICTRLEIEPAFDLLFEAAQNLGKEQEP